MFDDFASGHSFDVFEPPKQVADLGFELEHVMFAAVPRAAFRTFWFVRISRHSRICEKLAHAQTVSIFDYEDLNSVGGVAPKEGQS